MATASAPLFVECGFCLRRNENLKVPRLLPCGHIHCSECLDGTLESNKFIACPAPNCKQVLNDLVHELPEANIGSQKSAHMCGACKKKPATVYCTHECKKAFCLEHEKSHADLLSDHSTISVEEYSRLSRKHEKRVCSRHKNQPIVFGCRKCSQILCEDCNEPTGCQGAPHIPATIKTLFKEAKQEVEPGRAKAEKRKDELSAILKESERVLSTYREETQEILELVKSTRDEQIRVLKDKYEQLTSEITKQRNVTAEEIVKFRDEVVEEELSQLNMSLQRVVVTLNNDHMVDVVQNCKKSKDDISSAVRKDLPGLSIEKGVGLKVKGGSEHIRAEISAAQININIGKVPSGMMQRDELQSGEAATSTRTYSNSTASTAVVSPAYSTSSITTTAIQGASAGCVPRGSAAAAGATKPNDNEWPICMDDFKDPVALPCSHKFCKLCGDQVVKPAKSNLCPTCRFPFSWSAEGKQPVGGTMVTHRTSNSLPGYSRQGTISILYTIPEGIQGPEHPNPGQHYTGTARTAYLPDNTKGRRAEKLLRKAFNQRLVFTVGQSVTTGLDNCVVWNDIHHKTNTSGGVSNYGYPDPDYLDRLFEDLKAKGITD